MSAWDKILRAVVLTLDDELKLAAKKSQPSTGKAAEGSETSGPRSKAPDESGKASGASGAASNAGGGSSDASSTAADEGGETSGASGAASAESGETSGASGAASGGAPPDPQESTTTANEGAEAPPEEPTSDGEATAPQPAPTTTREDAPASSPSATTTPEASPEPDASAPTWDFGGATDSGAHVGDVDLDPAPHTVRAGAYRTPAPPVSTTPPTRVEVHLAQDDVWVRAANEPRVITEIRAWILGGIRRRRKTRPEASSESTRFEPPPRRSANTPLDRRAARPPPELHGLVSFEKLRNGPPPTVFGAMPRRGVGLAVDTSRMPAPAPARRPFVVSKPSWLGQPTADTHQESSAPQGEASARPQGEASAPPQSEASTPPQETSAPPQGEASAPQSEASAPQSEASAPQSEAHDDEDEDTPGVEIEPDRLGERPPVTGKGCPIPTRRRGEEWMRETLPPTTPGLVIEPERVGEAIPIVGMRPRSSKREGPSAPPADTPRHAAPTSAPQRPPPEPPPQAPRRHVVFDDDELDDIPIFADGSHIPDPDWPEQEGYDPPPLEDDLIDLDEFCDPDDPPDESIIVLCEGVE